MSLFSKYWILFSQCGPYTLSLQTDLMFWPYFLQSMVLTHFQSNGGMVNSHQSWFLCRVWFSFHFVEFYFYEYTNFYTSTKCKTSLRHLEIFCVFPLRCFYAQIENVQVSTYCPTPLVSQRNKYFKHFFPCNSVHLTVDINVFLQIRKRQRRIRTGKLDSELSALASALESKWHMSSQVFHLTFLLPVLFSLCDSPSHYG